MKVMYDTTVKVKLRETQLPRLTAKELLLPKHEAVADQDYTLIRAVYAAVMGVGSLQQ